MLDLRQKFTAFLKASGQAIFLIDDALFEAHNNDISVISKYLQSNMPALFGTDIWGSNGVIDFLKQVKKRHIIRANKAPKDTAIVSFLIPDKPMLDYMLYDDAHPYKNRFNSLNNAHWQDFALYHELFHTIDYRLRNLYISAFEPISLSVRHEAEFFADFSACLYMASRGTDMFEDVARMRLLNIAAESSKESFNRMSMTYDTHQIFKAFKQEKINPQGLNIDNIKNITNKIIETYAYNIHTLNDAYHTARVKKLTL